MIDIVTLIVALLSLWEYVVQQEQNNAVSQLLSLHPSPISLNATAFRVSPTRTQPPALQPPKNCHPLLVEENDFLIL